MAGERRLSVTMSDEAHDGWIGAPRIYGGNTSALAEAIGLALNDLDGPKAKLPRHWRLLFAEAARIERENRSRQGRRQT